MTLLTPQVQERINYRYKGNDYIEAYSLYNSQLHFLNAIKSIQKKEFPQLELNITVEASVKGSHVVPILLELIPLQGLFAGIALKESVEYIKSIFEIFQNLLEIHKILKDEKPINETINNNGTTEINFGSNNVFHIDTLTLKFYKENPNTVNEIAQSFKALEKNEEIEEIEISAVNNITPFVAVNRKDFESLSHSSPFLKEEESFKDRTHVTVFVKTTNFYPAKGRAWIWEFIYNGVPIKAKIVDKDFEDLINQGIRFGQGDRLDVDLRILYKKDLKLNTNLVKGYEVLKVHNPIYRDTNKNSMFPHSPPS
ncbi:MAG: hypothetical protein ABI367_08615 [Mucilaginibacter sp.]